MCLTVLSKLTMRFHRIFKKKVRKKLNALFFFLQETVKEYLMVEMSTSEG